MRRVMRVSGGRRTLRSTVVSIGTLGAVSALMVTGLVLVSTSTAFAAGVPTQLVFTTQPPSTSTAGGTGLEDVAVSVEDSSGQVVTTGTGATDAITLSTTGSPGMSGNTATASAGVAKFVGLVISNPGTYNFTATDSSPPDTGLSAATSTAVTVNSGAASKVAFTTEPTATTVAGVSLATLRVSVEDSTGQVVSTGTGATDSITVTSSCTLAGTTTATASAGVAAFSALVIDTGTSCTLTATDASRALTTATSTSVTVSSGAPTKLGFASEPPSTSINGIAVATLRVSVQDVYGNTVSSGTGATDSITITSTCTLAGTTTATASAGVVTFSALVIDTLGSCTLIAKDTSRTLTTVTSSAVDSQGAQTVLTLTSLSGTVGKPLTLTTSGGSGTGAITFSVTNGTATGCVVSASSLTVTSVGTCIVTATKAASITNLAISSPATTVTFVVPGPKATRVAGAVWVGKRTTVTILGSGFFGRPRVISNVAGITARVTRDTGRSLTVVVTVRSGVTTGAHGFTIILANGKRASVKYNLR